MKLAAIITAVVLGTFGLNNWHLIGLPSLAILRPNAVDLADAVNAADAVDAADAAPADPGTIRVTGRVQPRIKVAISSTLSLPIVELPFKEGDRVTRRGSQDDSPKPGSVLARLDDSGLRAALRASQAKRDAQAAEIEAAKVRLTALESQIASSRACLEEAERNWGRYRQVDSNSVSETESDAARCKYDRIKAEHDATLRGYAASKASLAVLEKNLGAAEAEVERARLNVTHATITSPIDGIVTRVNVKVGEVITGTITRPGTVLMEVADMDRMLLVARAGEESVGKLKAGEKAMVYLKGYGDQPFAGTVEKVALASTEEKDGTHYFKAEISLDTQGRRIPAGLAGEARIECPVPLSS